MSAEPCGRCGCAATEGALIFSHVRRRQRHRRSATTAGPGRVRIHAELALCTSCSSMLEKLLAGAVGRRNLVESAVIDVPPRRPS